MDLFIFECIHQNEAEQETHVADIAMAIAGLVHRLWCL